MTTSIETFKSSLLELLFKPFSFFAKLRNVNNSSLIFLLILGSVWITLSSTLKIEGNYFLKWPQLLVNSLIACAIGWFFLYINAIIGFLISKLVGGKGNISSTFTVLAYSFLPGIFLISTYLLVLLFPFDSGYSNYWSVAKGLLITINCFVFLWFLYIGLNGIIYFHKLFILKAFLVFLGGVFSPLLLTSAFFIF